MIERAKLCGLKFRQQSINAVVLASSRGAKYTAPTGTGRSHNTMTFGWSILEFIPHRKPGGSSRPSLFGISFPFFERRHIPQGALLHSSVIQRRTELGLWAPNIPDSYGIEQ
ncbi:hypothetical protein LRS12_06175 [Sphingomonas sp. J344]|uniref:hypothetical protein n=1 Tax=Sphingomonas sp. J344 TaxID=2898434 RepID=UPI0021508728|nr:hypothetical protein [Sphingomonas sp. J344]MCR5870344.1 hypothetical protein [Sphingomonas sp. J344]